LLYVQKWFVFLVVDSDLMALKPTSLTMKQAAALPLVSITVWEALHDKLAIAATLGADKLVNVAQQDVQNYVQQYTDGKGFDAVFDTVVGDNIQRGFEAARFNGAVATILPIENVLPVALKSLSFHSVLMLLPMVEGEGRAAHGKILTKIAQLVDDGLIKPLLDPSNFTIWQVAQAHAHLESGNAVGKITLTV
jgi:NADPH2:quinone reductase